MADTPTSIAGVSASLLRPHEEVGMRTFTREELRRHQGQDGAPICFACEGKVYDASKSWHWRGAMHHARHAAGEDLTEALATAPHGPDLLSRLPVIGLLRG